MKWKAMDRNLKDGEIIRFKTSKDPPNDYAYGKATGGFGMSMNTHGNAIFVENESYSYEDTRDGKSQDSARWERFWGIEILGNNGT
jgi:hypothetical protein